MQTKTYGTFEETFGENRGNDALFFLDGDDTDKKDVSPCFYYY